jgi:hypothetical protein
MSNERGINPVYFPAPPAPAPIPGRGGGTPAAVPFLPQGEGVGDGGDEPLHATVLRGARRYAPTGCPHQGRVHHASGHPTIRQKNLRR